MARRMNQVGAFQTHGSMPMYSQLSVGLLVSPAMARDQDFHIVVFTDTFLETNGVARYYQTLLDWCRRMGKMRVTVICPARDDLETNNPTCHVIPVRPSIQFRNPFYRDLKLGYYSHLKLCKIVRGIAGPKIVQVATSGSLGLAGTLVAGKLKLPLIGCYHSNLPLYGRLYGQSVLGRPGAWLGWKTALLCERLAFGRCQAICTASEGAVNTVRSFYRGEMEVIPCPVDLERFSPTTSRRGRFRDKYGSPGRILVVVVGRIAKEKNLDMLCELLGSDDRVDLVFVGDGPYAPSLKNRWDARITGFLEGDDLLAAYQQSDVFVQLSTSETFGLSLIEALACGLPAVVLRSEGFVESIPPNFGVEVLEPEGLSTLADRCVALVRDGTLHRTRAAQARELANRLGPDSVFPRLREFHRAYLHREGSPAKVVPTSPVNSTGPRLERAVG